MKTTKHIGLKCETQDGAFSNHAKHNKLGWSRSKARRRINKKIRQYLKKQDYENLQYE